MSFSERSAAKFRQIKVENVEITNEKPRRQDSNFDPAFDDSVKAKEQGNQCDMNLASEAENESIGELNDSPELRQKPISKSSSRYSGYDSN